MNGMVLDDKNIVMNGDECRAIFKGVVIRVLVTKRTTSLDNWELKLSIHLSFWLAFALVIITELQDQRELARKPYIESYDQ